MDLIDWPLLARSALWIVGLSMAVAVLSHGSWSAAVRGEPFLRTLDRPAIVLPISIGMLLVFLSLAWGATRVWERGLWVVLGIAFCWQIFEAVRRQREARSARSGRADGE
jgi:hypothetical protein